MIQADLNPDNEASQQEERLMFKFIEWLLPTTVGDRLARGGGDTSRTFRCQRWDDFWWTFKVDGRMEWEDFEYFLRNHGTLSVNARKLFDLLDDTGDGWITARAVLEVRRQYEKSTDVRHSSLADLKSILCKAYGSLMRSWWLLFDKDQTGRCAKTVFLKAAREVGFHGDLKRVWSEVTSGEVYRVITPRDLDPEADAVMLEVAGALKRFYGSVRDSWFAIMRAHGACGVMHQQQFKIVCEDMGLRNGEGKKVYSWIDLDINSGIDLEEWLLFALWESRIKDDRPLSFVNSGQEANIASQFGRGALVDKNDGPLPEWCSATMLPPSKGGGRVGYPADSHASETQPFEFVVTLTKEEHEELQRRRRQVKATTRPSLAAGMDKAKVNHLAGGVFTAQQRATLIATR